MKELNPYKTGSIIECSIHKNEAATDICIQMSVTASFLYTGSGEGIMNK